MTNLAIRVENLSKQYRIGRPQARYKTIRETISDAAQAPFRRVGKLLRGQAYGAAELDETFWALKDVSFEIKPGEVVGIIGPNGAGKSTLLKILSRITDPTEGCVDIYGRVGSLLEVGTGFHPELTGRENIYLNGAILGMSRVEIEYKFGEIVAFAEIEKFIDTPAKHYSSGMYVRLAFAVAAHLEPEILIVDEVLAVGDAAFQRKSLGKMESVSKEGRTVLFVSHNMAAISRICERAILIQSGEIIKDDSSSEVISEYLTMLSEKGQYFSQPADVTIPLSLLEAKVFSEESSAPDAFPIHKPIKVQMKYEVNREISSVHIYSSILTMDGISIIGTGDADTDQTRFGPRKPGTYICEYQIPARLLNEGKFKINISMGIPFQGNIQVNNGIMTFSVVDSEQSEKYMHGRRESLLLLDIPWKYLGDNPFNY